MVKYGQSDHKKFKYENFQNFKKNPKKSSIFFCYPRLLLASLHLRFYRWYINSRPIYRWYFRDFPYIFPIFLSFDNLLKIVSRSSDIRYISEISPIKTKISIHAWGKEYNKYRKKGQFFKNVEWFMGWLSSTNSLFFCLYFSLNDKFNFFHKGKWKRRISLCHIPFSISMEQQWMLRIR